MIPHSARAFALEIAERIHGLGAIGVKRFFGGMALTSGGVQFGFIMKGSLYLRVDERMRADLAARGGAPFAYEGASGLVTVASYYEASADVLEDDRILSEWATEAVRAAISAKAGVSYRAPTRGARAASSALKRPRKSRAMA
jgi:TfoX/Sxy family transcriptional regulator of competence genes